VCNATSSTLLALQARYAWSREIDSTILQRVADQSRTVSVAAGTELFTHGKACAAFPLVLRGAVRVLMRSANGREIQLYRVAPGETCVLSTGCLLGDSPHSADAVATEPADLLLVPPPLFRQLIETQPLFRQAIFAQYSERMAELLALVEAVAFQRLDQRLAARLLDPQASLAVSHAALARELGSVREIVSRLLGQFAERGLVRLTRAQIEVLDPDGLRQLARTTD
jgi:CRP/FNR family transcriptional regulator, anaerobic regulatory protein